MNTAPTALSLDVRATIAAGGEPLPEILAAADVLAEGGTLDLTAPFEPLPLYQVMRRRGFAHQTTPQGPGEYRVRFTNTGITPEVTLSEVASRRPEVAPVLARHGFDLCCGGAKPVEVAARAHGVSLDALLDELHQAVMSP